MALRTVIWKWNIIAESSEEGATSVHYIKRRVQGPIEGAFLSKKKTSREVIFFIFNQVFFKQALDLHNYFMMNRLRCILRRNRWNCISNYEIIRKRSVSTAAWRKLILACLHVADNIFKAYCKENLIMKPVYFVKTWNRALERLSFQVSFSLCKFSLV